VVMRARPLQCAHRQVGKRARNLCAHHCAAAHALSTCVSRVVAGNNVRTVWRRSGVTCATQSFSTDLQRVTSQQSEPHVCIAEVSVQFTGSRSTTISGRCCCCCCASSDRVPST
jgi:capsid protein